METPDLTDLNLPEKEQRILEAAIRIFSEKGFSAATTNEIAKNAGVAEGTIFRYFKTKKDILRGILIQTVNMLSSKLAIDSIEKILLNSENKDLRQILKEVIYDRLKLVDSVFPMIRIIITEALYHEDVRTALYENIVDKAFSIFKVFYEKMVEQGILRNDVEPIVLFRSTAANIAVLIAQRKLLGDKIATGNFDEDSDKMIDVLLYGITAQNHRGQG